MNNQMNGTDRGFIFYAVKSSSFLDIHYTIEY